ncbi:Por secretion system C-terminal sorting domain-containing protein [Lishizhenia tianjinensis]|uniref:Por secretion system C-terminal sorting domain-containing protein n=1 Tax=Lishizhenia tianjinensis TaxID=477690 RepID=A0A1I6YTJ9_9FLAO|nr:T9SS type A sorting domain-containing protein [Lishizhenia tianjinensis]SFT53795.1 Por secretion system C-terminal sorting domain-containing protein [Lishizhenia tianjinensis]
MKSTLTLLGILFISGVSSAQISLTSSDFQSSPGAEYYSSANTNVDFTSTGANYTWDFSNLNEVSQDTINYNSLTQASLFIQAAYGIFAPPAYQANYFQENTDFTLSNIPSTVLPINIDRVDNFIKVENTQIAKVGYGISVQGQAIPFPSDTIERLYKLPLNYGDVDSSRAYTSFDLNPIYDAQLRQYIQHYSEVDGYGNISTPYGSFPCLRIHHRIVELDSVYISLNGAAGAWYELPLPTKHIYEWWTNNEDIAILRIETTENFGIQTVSKTEYKDNISVGTEEASPFTEFYIYPNPTRDGLFFSHQVRHLTLRNTAGQIVLTKDFTTYLNVSKLPTGAYLLEVEIDGETKQERLLIQ